MQFYRDMYISESLQDKLWKIKWKLKHHKHMPGIYVIVLSGYNDEIEFYHCAYLQQDYYKKNPPFVVGVADSWEGACELVVQMMKDILEKTGSYHIGEYIRGKVSNY